MPETNPLETNVDRTTETWPSSTSAWTLVTLLVVAYALAFVDRQILTLLVEPVRRDLEITDTQFSLLAGLAFTLFYTLMGIPFAWLADRGSRRNLIVASVTFWSAMTALCGLANNFLTLFLALGAFTLLYLALVRQRMQLAVERDALLDLSTSES